MSHNEKMIENERFIRMEKKKGSDFKRLAIGTVIGLGGILVIYLFYQLLILLDK